MQEQIQRAFRAAAYQGSEVTCQIPNQVRILKITFRRATQVHFN